MDSLRLARALDLVPTLWDLDEIDGLLITRHGRIVLETSFHPNTPRLRHELHSVTKSVTSTLVGIAVQKGMIRVDDPVLSYFPGRTFSNMSADKAAMRVRNLLSMQSGLAFQEFPLTGNDNSHARLLRSADWARFTLDLPMAARPGSRFNYSDGDMAILSGILSKATGGRISEFAAEELFAPLGITNVDWRRDPQGNSLPNDGLFLTPRDQAKIGYLYLRGGMWKGRRILPSSWVQDIVARSVRATGWTVPRYGMLWWVDRRGGLFSASGTGGQYSIVMPRQDIVAVVNAKQGAVVDAPGFLEIAHELILPAVKSDRALPENLAAFQRLQERIERFESPAPRPVPRPPETAARVSGRRILLEPNPLGATSLTLHFSGDEASAEIESNGTIVRLPVGLDGIERTSDPVGTVQYSSFGFWDDERSFCVESRVLQGDFLNRISFRFSGGTVLVTYTVSDELWQSFSFTGHFADPTGSSSSLEQAAGASGSPAKTSRPGRRSGSLAVDWDAAVAAFQDGMRSARETPTDLSELMVTRIAQARGRWQLGASTLWGVRYQTSRQRSSNSH